MKKYPVLKCDEKLWKEIKPVLEGFGINKFYINDFIRFSFLVSNFTYPNTDRIIVGNIDEPRIDHPESLRYLVNTKEEFLSAVAKLLNKEYKIMEERNIKVSLEKAKEWHNSDNVTLKELALQAFTEKELTEVSYNDILEKSTTHSLYTFATPCAKFRKWEALHRLAIIAEYLNKGWEPDWNNGNEPKWFLYKKGNKIIPEIYYSNNYGIVYFKSKALALKAVEIMGEEINYIFD